MARPLPPLPAFRAFVAVAREGSFARAAASLHVSVSAVSHQIRALEDHIGTALLTRARNGAGHRPTAPTPAGAVLLAGVEDGLARLADACDQARATPRRATAALTISANGSLASLWLAPRLAAYAGRHVDPAWQMRAIENETPDLVRETIDLAILRVRPGAATAADHFLFRETLFPICSPILDLGDGAKGLLRHTLLEEEHGGDIEKSWPHWLALLGEPAASARIVRFSGFNQVVGAAIAGAGVAIGRAPLIDDELAAGRLVRPLPGPVLPGSRIFVLRTRPGRARHPEVARLRSFLLAAAPPA